MVAAWLPARRTGRIAPVQALRDDVALPESSVRRRLLLGIALIALGHPARGDRPVRRCGPAQRVVGRRRRAGRAAGGDRGQPGDRAAVPAGDRRGRREAVRADRAARRPELAAQPAAYDRHRVGADDRADPGLHRGDPRRRLPRRRWTRRWRTTSSATSSSAARSARGTRRRSPTGWPTSTAWSQVLRERFGYGLHDGDPTYVVATAPETISDFDMTMDSGRATDLADGTVLVEKDWASENHVTTGRHLRDHGADRQEAVADRRRLRGDPADLLAGPHHHPDPDRLRLPRPGQLRGDLRRGRGGRGRAPGAARRRGEGPAGRDGEGRAGVRRRAARPDRPDHRGHLRAAGASRC